MQSLFIRWKKKGTTYVSILALLKAQYYIESPYKNDLAYVIEILCNLPEKASVYIMQYAQDLMEEYFIGGVVIYNEGNL